MSMFTRDKLTQSSMHYIKHIMEEPMRELVVDNRKILLLHGDIDNPYWGKLTPSKINDPRYSPYDYVFCGHTHHTFKVEAYFEVDDPVMRNQKRTTFINPGSVGQPRNHNPHAQYVYIDILTGETHFNTVSYNIDEEQRLYPDEIDKFYSERLKYGI